MLFNPNRVHSRTSLVLFMLASILTLYFVFSPTISIPSYHHDTYKYSYGIDNPTCNTMVGYEFSFQLARPFTAFLDCANYKFANTIAKMGRMRLLVDLLIGFTAAILVFWFSYAKFELLPAFLISVAIFCLPGMNAAMIMGGTFLILPVLTVLVAYLFFDKGCKCLATHKVRAVLYIALAITGLIIAFLTYPSMTGFFLLPAMVFVLFTPLDAWSATRKIVVRDIIIYCFSCLLYFVTAHIIKAYLHLNSADLPAPYRMDINFHLLDRWANLIQVYPFFWDLDFWVSDTQKNLIWALTIIGMLLGLRRFFTANLAKNILLQVLIAAFFLINLASIVYLLQPYNMVAERILFAYQAMCVLVLVWCLQQISLLFKSKSESLFILALTLLFAFGAVTMNSKTTKLTLVNDHEFNYIANQLAAHINNEKITRIHVITGKQAPIIGQSTYFPDDTTSILHTALQTMPHANILELKPCVSSTLEPDALHQLEMKCMASLPKGAVAVTHSRYDAPVYASPNMLVIDMNYANRLDKNLHLAFGR